MMINSYVRNTFFLYQTWHCRKNRNIINKLDIVDEILYPCFGGHIKVANNWKINHYKRRTMLVLYLLCTSLSYAVMCRIEYLNGSYIAHICLDFMLANFGLLTYQTVIFFGSFSMILYILYHGNVSWIAIYIMVDF
jgi:hypothetical protein